LKERCLEAANLVGRTSAHCRQEDRGWLQEQFRKFPKAMQRLFEDIQRRDLATAVGLEYVKDSSKNEEFLVDVLNDFDGPLVQQKLQALNDATDAQDIARFSASVLGDYSKLKDFEVEDDEPLAGQKLDSDESSGVDSGCVSEGGEDLEMDDVDRMRTLPMKGMAQQLEAEGNTYLMQNFEQKLEDDGVFFFKKEGICYHTEKPCNGVLITRDADVQWELMGIHDYESTQTLSIDPALLTEAHGVGTMHLRPCAGYFITDTVDQNGNTNPTPWGGGRVFKVVSHNINEMEVQRLKLVRHDPQTAVAEFGRRKRTTRRVVEEYNPNADLEVEQSKTFTRDGRQQHDEQSLSSIKGLVYVRFEIGDEEYWAEIVKCDTKHLGVKIDNGRDSHNYVWEKTLAQKEYEKAMKTIKESLPGVEKVEMAWTSRVAPPHHIPEEMEYEVAKQLYGVATHMITPDNAQSLGCEPGPLDCLVKLDEKKTSGKGKTPAADHAGTYNVVLRGDVINNADLTKAWRVLPPDTQLPGSNMQENMTPEAYAMLCQTLRTKYANGDIKFPSAEWIALTRKQNLGHWGPNDWMKVNFGLTAGVDKVHIVAPDPQGWPERCVFHDTVKVTKDSVRELTQEHFREFNEDGVTGFIQNLRYLDYVELKLQVSELCCVVGIGEQKTQIEECLRELHACVNDKHCLDSGCRKDRIRVLFLEDDRSSAAESSAPESGDESPDSVSSGSQSSGSDGNWSA